MISERSGFSYANIYCFVWFCNSDNKSAKNVSLVRKNCRIAIPLQTAIVQQVRVVRNTPVNSAKTLLSTGSTAIFFGFVCGVIIYHWNEQWKIVERLLCCQGNMSLPWSHETPSLVNEMTSSSTSSASRGDVRITRQHVSLRKLLMEGER